MKRFIPFLMMTALWSANSGAQSEADKEAILETFETWNSGRVEAQQLSFHLRIPGWQLGVSGIRPCRGHQEWVTGSRREVLSSRPR